jgi:large subunit ribosomal protein L25
MKKEQVLINAEERQISTKAYLNSARKNGLLPACIYGKSIKQNLNIFVKENEIIKILEKYGESHPLTISIKNKKIDVIIKDFQYSIINNKMSHVDFYAVSSSEKIKTHIPLNFVGHSKGEKAGGIVEKFHLSVEVEGSLKDIPESIEINIENMDIGTRFHASDLKLPENLHLLTNPQEVLFIIAGKKATEAETGPAGMTAEEAEKAKEIFD